MFWQLVVIEDYFKVGRGSICACFTACLLQSSQFDRQCLAQPDGLSQSVGTNFTHCWCIPYAIQWARLLKSFVFLNRKHSAFFDLEHTHGGHCGELHRIFVKALISLFFLCCEWAVSVFKLMGLYLSYRTCTQSTVTSITWRSSHT